MIKIDVDPLVPSKQFPDASNAYVQMLDYWKEFLEQYHLIHVKGGSERMSLDPGQWCIQNYSRTVTEWRGMRVCFHPDDRIIAMLFKLTWGGQ